LRCARQILTKVELGKNSFPLGLSLSLPFLFLRPFFPHFPPLFVLFHFCWQLPSLFHVLDCVVLCFFGPYLRLGEIDPSSPHSGIQYGDTPVYSNPPSLFGTSPGTMTLLGVGNGHARGKIRLARQRRETSNSVLGEWGEVFSSGSGRGGGCCS
jgi:hypothetical protein